jgi:hypothetical protein
MMMKLPAGVTNPNKHPYCAADRCAKIKARKGSVVLKISDTCWACKDYDVDVADDIFPLLDDPAKGRVKASWEFVKCSFLNRTKPHRTFYYYEKTSILKLYD